MPSRTPVPDGRIESILADNVVRRDNGTGTSLSSALHEAFSDNPELKAARAQLSATAEDIVQARSALFPKIDANVATDTTRNFGDLSRRYSSVVASIDASQNLFDGFQASSNTSAAKARTSAVQQTLKSLEQEILLRAATAYMNVLRDRKVLVLRKRNLAYLDEQVRSAQTRFSIGESTITDVAQASSQQALAAALLNSAIADVSSSEAVYVQVIGTAPGALRAASIPKKLLPASAAAALSIAEIEHPLIMARRYSADAAEIHGQVG